MAPRHAGNQNDNSAAVYPGFYEALIKDFKKFIQSYKFQQAREMDDGPTKILIFWIVEVAHRHS